MGYFITETVGTSYISQSSVLHMYKEYVLEGNIAVKTERLSIIVFLMIMIIGSGREMYFES